jgi:hypothetical protein
MKKILIALCALAVPAAIAADVNQQILEKLDNLQRQVMEQQAEINTLKAQLAEQSDVSELVRAELDSAIEAKGLAQVKDMGPIIQLPKQVEGLKIQGDLRLRYERRITDNDAIAANETNQDRFRTRFRIGAIWQTTDGWEIGAGLATGDNNTATSAQDTWSNGAVFETGNIWLDYAYAKHTWNCYTVIVGQSPNPFKSSFLLWDSDLRPIGVTGQYQMDGLFAIVGWYDVFDPGADEDLAQMIAGQIGYEMDVEGMDMLMAAAYYHFNDAISNTLGAASDVSYDVVDLYVKASMPLEDMTLSAYGEVWKNFTGDGNVGDGQLGGTIDPEGNDLGWVLGIGAEMGKFTVDYAYGRVESDSFPGVLKDADFGATAGVNNTNVKGHKLQLGYQLTENMSVNGTMLDLNGIEGQTQDGKLYQIDLNYKF